VVVGSVGDDFPDAKQDLFVARFEPDGSLDGEFGTGGVVTTDLGGVSEAAKDVVVQPDGRIVVAASGLFKPPTPYPDSSTDLVVLRYHSDGSLDPGFGSGGVLHVEADFGAYFFVEGLGLARDGTILVGGNTGLSYRDSNSAAIARVRGDGSLDRIVRFAAASDRGLSAMAFEPRRGRIYLAGSMPRRKDGSKYVMYVAAVRENDLSVDRGFGVRGLARADFRGTPNDFATSVISDRRGRVVVAGAAGGRRPAEQVRAGAESRFAVARFTAGGKLDRRFGRRGLARVRFPYRQSVAQAVLEHPARRLVVVGIGAGASRFVGEPSGCALAVARLVAR
jgi:uncharacterized delta-60 repeat protein